MTRGTLERLRRELAICDDLSEVSLRCGLSFETVYNYQLCRAATYVTRDGYSAQRAAQIFGVCASTLQHYKDKTA